MKSFSVEKRQEENVKKGKFSFLKKIRWKMWVNRLNAYKDQRILSRNKKITPVLSACFNERAIEKQNIRNISAIGEDVWWGILNAKWKQLEYITLHFSNEPQLMLAESNRITSKPIIASNSMTKRIHRNHSMGVEASSEREKEEKKVNIK